MSDTHQTHFNVFVQEFEAAHKKALAAIDDLKAKADALYGKYKDIVREASPDVYKTIHDVETDVEQVASDVEKALKAPAKKAANETSKDGA